MGATGAVLCARRKVLCANRNRARRVGPVAERPRRRRTLGVGGRAGGPGRAPATGAVDGRPAPTDGAKATRGAHRGAPGPSAITAGRGRHHPGWRPRRTGQRTVLAARPAARRANLVATGADAAATAGPVVPDAFHANLRLGFGAAEPRSGLAPDRGPEIHVATRESAVDRRPTAHRLHPRGDGRRHHGLDRQLGHPLPGVHQCRLHADADPTARGGAYRACLPHSSQPRRGGQRLSSPGRREGAVRHRRVGRRRALGISGALRRPVGRVMLVGGGAVTFWTLISDAAQRESTRTLLADEHGRSLTARQLRDAACATAAALAERGVRADTVVSWQLPTTLETMVVMAA